MPTRSFIDYEWDSAKAASNLQKHKVSLERVLDLEWDNALVMEDERRPYGEKRFIAYAPIGDRLYAVVYSPRGLRRRIISLRRANSREVARYEHAKEA